MCLWVFSLQVMCQSLLLAAKLGINRTRLGLELGIKWKPG